MAFTVTNKLLADYLLCPYKAYLKSQGKSGRISEYERIQEARLRRHRRLAEASLAERFPINLRRGSVSADQIVSNKVPLATDVTYAAVDIRFTFDALIDSGLICRSNAKSSYLPVTYAVASKIAARDRTILATGLLLLTGNRPIIRAEGVVVHGPACSLKRINVKDFVGRAAGVLKALFDLVRGASPPPFRLNAHCSVCEFSEDCLGKAKANDHLSLLRGLRPKQIERLNSRGIFTVTQYSYLFRPRRKKKRPNVLNSKHRYDLQALSIRTDTIHIDQEPELPNTKTKVYLDIEGIPDRGFYYLIGMFILDDRSVREYSFWASNEDEETQIWESLIRVITNLDDFTIFHFGSYDRTALDKLHNRHGRGNGDLMERIRSACFDVLAAIRGHVYFPVHSNDLKSIATTLGFLWRDPDPSGLNSIVWRLKWEQRRLSSLKQRLTEYNLDDCQALKVVCDALVLLSSEHSPSSSTLPKNVVRSQEIRQDMSFGYLHHNPFYPELKVINHRAYFDYQMEKVYVRTHPHIRRRVKRKARKRARKLRFRANKEVSLPRMSSCPKCSGTHMLKHGPLTKVVYDLRFFNGGLKRWVVRYSSNRYRCWDCWTAFTPDCFKEVSSSKYGRGLRAWVICQCIAYLQSQKTIADQVRELFGYSLPGQAIKNLKKAAARCYKETYEEILSSVRAGEFVHVDETKIDTRQGRGYIWVFANLQEVAYVYSDSREGETPAQVLAGFTGVLVSDFYAGYDRLECEQQKCLIHLLRDINDDLHRNPLDREFRDLARALVGILGPIVQEIDKRGLKRRFLAKYRKPAERYIEDCLRRTYVSDVARKYQKRFRKYRLSLFTFLKYDGISWNNNNAEHAIKSFALMRKAVGPNSTPDGIREYLLLLSICETLKRRGLSFLDFLVSGKTDLSDFAREYGE